MRFAIVIPARFASGRYPGKPLAPLRGAAGTAKPLIQRSWEAACLVAGAAMVVVATDDERVARVARDFGARVVMTPSECANGTERCAATLAHLPSDIDAVVNLQGDAPLTPPHVVEALMRALGSDPATETVTPVIRADARLHRRLLDDQRAGRVGGTTAVADAAGNAMYFSKAVIPHVGAERIGDPEAAILFHLGVYAYRRGSLARYATWPATRLEMLEGLEQLRFLAYATPVKLVEVDVKHDMWELNNPSDVPLIEQALAARGIA